VGKDIVMLEEPIIACSYHSRNGASWICDSCEINYCDACIPNGHSLHWGSDGPKCVQCNRPLFYNAENEDIPPFWTQLPNFLRYAAHKDCLTYIVVVALSSVILPLVLGLGLIGILLFLAGSLILLSLTFKYSFLIIEKRSMNNVDPPSYDELIDSDEHFLFVKLVVATFVLYGAAAFLSGDSIFVLNVLNGLVALLLPAITIILALEKSLVSTLNPAMIASFIGRIGWPYLLLWLCYQIITGGSALLYVALESMLPTWLLVPAVLFVSLYFWFSANCMLGYVVYQYHDALGHTSFLEFGDDDSVNKIEWERKRILAEAYIHVRENKAEAARNLLRPMLDQYAEDKELHIFYHRVLALLDDIKSLRNHADYAIDFLVAKRDVIAATSLYLDTVKKLPSYQPNRVKNAFAIAQCMDQRGQRQAIVKLLNNIHKVEPKAGEIPDAYFLLAKVYNEHLGKELEASRIVRFLIDKFPQFKERKALVAYAKSLGQ
jgi:tetratricopeptide (TPR) repeat protein